MPETIFGLPEFRPYAMRWQARRRTFLTYRLYYNGKIYKDSAFKIAHKLYAETRALYSLIQRAVNLDVALIPGVNGPWALTEGTPQQIIDAQDQLYKWSKWGIAGAGWIKDGATLGEAMLKIVPDPTGRIVQLQRLKPEQAMLISGHPDREGGPPTDLALIVDNSGYDSDGERYEYAEAITPAEIRTYRNGAPFGYDGNPDRFPNPLGFVPVIKSDNDTDGATTFDTIEEQLDAMNEEASYLADIIGRHLEPQWAAMGVESSDVVRSGDNIWFFPPPDAKLQAILADIDIGGALSFVEAIKEETKSNLPELAFDDLRAKDQIATETLKVQLIELHAKIWRMRRHYDSALESAHVMAAVAAGIYGITDLAPLLAPHEIDPTREVLPESPLDSIQLEMAELALEQQRRIAGGESLTAAVNAGAEVSVA